MPWFKVDDTLWSHPKFAALSDAAQALWLRAGSYSAEKLTDGVVSEQIVAGLLRGKKRTVDELVEAGLWRRIPDGVEFHDWLEYQPSAETVKRSREQARERMRNVRANRRGSSPNPVPVPVNQDRYTNPPLVDARAGDDVDPVLASVVEAVASMGLVLHPMCAADVVAFIDGRRRRSAGPPAVPTRYYPDAIRGSWPEVEKFIHERGLVA